MRSYIVLLLNLCISVGWANSTLNVYAWGGEIPKQVLQQFEKETQIKVSFSTYDSNEILYAKMKAGADRLYDVIMPSGYYVERMRRQKMLTPINPKSLPNFNNLDEAFRSTHFDPKNRYSVPMIWGVTGIFYDSHYPPIQAWQQLWDKQFAHQILLLDDAREVFSMALLRLGYSPNDHNPEHIHKAYQMLQQLRPNVKLFASDNVKSTIIDKDALLGMAWSGDVYKAQRENKDLRFSFPREGFIMWVDCLAIPARAPHPEAAKQFINFMLRPDIAVQIALVEGHALTNAKAKELLPVSIRSNPILYPDPATLRRGHFQRDVPNDILRLYAGYWQQLKLS